MRVVARTGSRRALCLHGKQVMPQCGVSSVQASGTGAAQGAGGCVGRNGNRSARPRTRMAGMVLDCRKGEGSARAHGKWRDGAGLLRRWGSSQAQAQLQGRSVRTMEKVGILVISSGSFGVWADFGTVDYQNLENQTATKSIPRLCC